MKPKLPDWAQPECRLIPSEIRQDIQRLIDEAYTAGMADAREWRSIESAPKDGTEILVYVRGDSVFPTAASFKTAEYFEKEYGDRDYMEEGWYWAFGYPSDFHECVIEPTHWMPLPPPPTQRTEGGAKP